MTRRHWIGCSIIFLATGLPVEARQGATPPSPPAAVAALTGHWELDGFFGAAPFGLRNEHAVCALPPRTMDRREVPDGAEQVHSIGSVEGAIVISATASTLTIERRYGGSVATGSFTGTYALDGSETTSHSGDLSGRAKVTLTGNGITVSSVISRTEPAASATCALKETFQVDPTGVLHVVAVGETGGHSLTARQQYVKKTATLDSHKEQR